MNRTDTYKLLSNLPRIPNHHVDNLKKLYQNPDRTTYTVSPVGYTGRTLYINGQIITSTQSNRYLPDAEFLQWAQTHIVDTWTECGLSVTQVHVESAVHGAHTDSTRAYILLYLLDSGGDNATVSWYQEQGYPAFRPNDPGHTVCDYSTIDLIDQVCPPTHTWALYNVRILHGVENLFRDRVSIQIGLTEKDFEKILSRYK